MEKTMKKIILKTIIFLSLFMVVAFSCHITFTPDRLKLKKGAITNIIVHVKWEHRKCELDDDDVNVDYIGVKKLKIGEWTKVKRGLYKNTIKIKVLKEFAKIRVWRECTKKGLSEGIILVGIKEEQNHKIKKGSSKLKQKGCNGDCKSCLASK